MRPSPPRNPQASRLANGDLLITWQPPAWDGGAPIRHYGVRVPTNRQPGLVLDDPVISEFTVTGTSLTVPLMSVARTPFQITVWANNDSTDNGGNSDPVSVAGVPWVQTLTVPANQVVSFSVPGPMFSTAKITATGWWSHGVERLGGFDPSGYCRSIGQTGANLAKPVLGPGAAYDNLFCEPAGFFIDPHAACRWQYPGAQEVVARLENPNDATTWKCYGYPTYGPGGYVSTSGSWTQTEVRLGGLDLSGYCRSIGQTGANLLKPVLGPGVAFDNFICEPGGFFIDMQAACRWQYPSAQGVVARVENPDDAASWKCYGTVSSWSPTPVTTKAGAGAPVPDGPLGALVYQYTFGKMQIPSAWAVFSSPLNAWAGSYGSTYSFALNEPPGARADNRGALTLTITIN